MRYGHALPDGSFIGRYMRHMNAVETAEAYDFWTALWLLSVACGRSVIVDRPRVPVYLNLYVILVAESGVTRKSTAVRTATALANEIYDDDKTVGIIEGKTVPEKLDDMLHQRSKLMGSAQLAISVSELAVFLGVERYTATMPALLTDLYDCPALRRGGGSITRGGLDQRDLWVAFLSASTPAWLTRCVNPTVMEGGFTSRCMFVVSEQPKRRIAWPSETGDRTATNELATQLRATRTKARLYKAIIPSAAALRVFAAWYNKRPAHRDTYNASFEAREDSHVLRIAALLSVNDDTWAIQPSHVKHAIRIIEHVKQCGARLFEGTTARDKWHVAYERLSATLLASGRDPMPRSKLFLNVRNAIDNAQFAALLDVLHELGAIQRFVVKQEGAGRPTDLIRGTDQLAKRGVAALVMERLLS